MFKVKPTFFVPTLYFIEGLPYAMVNLMSVVMLKNLGASNEFIGLVTSLLSLPWVLKATWAPVIDLISTRRNWVLMAHVVLAALSLALAGALMTPYAVPAAVGLFALTAFVSATQDIAMDGYYMDVLDKDDQALFVGFRQTAYKVAVLTGQGALVYLAGSIGERMGVNVGWALAFVTCNLFFLAAATFHWFALPKPEQSKANVDETESGAKQLQGQFKQVFSTFFAQPGAAAIVTYILTFRLGDALMTKMAVPFLLDAPAKGGLGISTVQESFIYGTIGMIFSLIGGISASYIVSRQGIKRCLLPAAIIQSAAIPLYIGLAVFRPGLEVVAVANAFEQLSYGIGTTAYIVYLLNTVRPEFKASHYALATGLMALGMLVPGAVSGFIAELGYPTFFLISFSCSLPGLFTIKFLPFNDLAESETLEEIVAPVIGH